jgi:hypothetical protein
MSTRNGKIARLPKPLRDQLARRIEDGEQGKDLVEWLNALPAVQDVPRKQFAARPSRGAATAQRKDQAAVQIRTAVDCPPAEASAQAGGPWTVDC